MINPSQSISTGVNAAHPKCVNCWQAPRLAPCRGLVSWRRPCSGLQFSLRVTTAVLWGYRVPHRWAPALAILRGAIQLALLSIVLTGIISSPLWVGVALVVMFAVAAATATSRVGWSAKNAAIMGSAMAAGILVAMSVVFLSGAIEFSPRYVLAIGGIVIGNAMSIATLAGRRFVESTGERWDEVEGWMALGATPRQSTFGIARSAVYSALIPITDQTKTTGLVALPGAFVGAIFGGASPLALHFQSMTHRGLAARPRSRERIVDRDSKFPAPSTCPARLTGQGRSGPDRRRRRALCGDRADAAEGESRPGAAASTPSERRPPATRRRRWNVTSASIG